MHYYQFNIADYRKDTTHLTPMEHYIYRTLIDWCYLDESGIPKETQSVLRRLRLGSESAILLQNVLNDFFVATEKGFIHKRIAIDIENYHAMQERNKVNGSRGGRPKKQQLSDKNKPKKTQSVSSGLQDETDLKGNQEPITKNQEPIDNSRKRKRFTPPTLEQCIEHSGNQAESEKFILYYESNGWRVGKNKMANWKSSLTGWIKRSQEYAASKQKTNQPSDRTLTDIIYGWED
jgi:uncharacterized protein YdaU (DUF1376 family)